jgi:hypothetical protein
MLGIAPDLEDSLKAPLELDFSQYADARIAHGFVELHAGVDRAHVFRVDISHQPDHGPAGEH